MPKKQASRKQSGEELTLPSTVKVLYVPPGLQVEGSNPLEEIVVEVNVAAMWKRLARMRRQLRVPSNKWEEEFVNLWRRGLDLRVRLRSVRRADPKTLWTSDEDWAHTQAAVEFGTIRERIMWKFGGLGLELAKRIASRQRSNEGLAAANRAREAGLRGGLKHKAALMRKYEPSISRRAIARRLLEEGEEDNRRCHDCQSSGRVSAGEERPRCTPCERRRLNGKYGKCRPCKECIRWYLCFSQWRDGKRAKLIQKVGEKDMKERMCDTLARRIGKL